MFGRIFWRKPAWLIGATLLFSLVAFPLIDFYPAHLAPHPVYAQSVCTGEFIPVSQPLNDLGANEYIRMDGTPTGYMGGLYPGGVNSRPNEHEVAGVDIASQITPLNAAGVPDPNGRIVMISVGMSNTAAEFIEFIQLAAADPAVNPQVTLVNGAQPGQTSPDWVDPNAPAWNVVDQRLANAGLTPLQVQVVWVKLTRIGPGNFPGRAQELQHDLEIIARNLKIRYPNSTLAYYSSRTRSFTYWQGLSPEPTAFETAFSVRWMLENQINGDPDLNYDPANGPVVAPWLSWSAYLWIDGLNPRSDGRVWLHEDMVADCTHPSDSGELKVAEQLLDFFKYDTTARLWFAVDPSTTPTPSPTATSIVTTTPSPTTTNTITPTPTQTPTPSLTLTATPTTTPPTPTVTPSITATPPTVTPSPTPPTTSEFWFYLPFVRLGSSAGK